jgi:hypothetical protein
VMASTLMRVASSTCFPPTGILPGALVSLLYGLACISPCARPRSRHAHRCARRRSNDAPNQETKMLIWTKFALCAAIVLSTAATASAATKK